MENWLFTVLFLLISGKLANAVIRKDGYCVMYGQKKYFKTPKHYNGPAKLSVNESYAILKETCPYLATGRHDGAFTCCALDQLKSLQDNLKQAAALFSRGPSCAKNFYNMLCELTCSPNQSTFVKYDGSASFYITEKFATGLYDSCKDVTFPGNNRKVMDIMCGTSAKLCTKEKFLNFVGNPSNGAPFTINFVIGKNKTPSNITNNDLHMISINKTSMHKDNGSEQLASKYSKARLWQVNITSTVPMPVDVYHVYQQREGTNFSGMINKDAFEKVLDLQLRLMNINASYKGETVRLSDVCFKPRASKNKECTVFSALQYYQLNKTRLNMCITNFIEQCDDPYAFGVPAEDWHDQFLDCTRNPSAISTGFYLHLPCLANSGVPVPPKAILGGFDGNDYTNAKSLIMTFLVKNHTNQDEKRKTEAWESEFVKFLKDYKKREAPWLNLNITYSGEDSTQDET